MNPRALAARILDTARDYPAALCEGERALVVELEARDERRAGLEHALELGAWAGRVRIDTLELELRRALERHQVFEDAAYRWREKWLAAEALVAQMQGELGMARLELEGYRNVAAPAALPAPPPLFALEGGRHD